MREKLNYGGGLSRNQVLRLLNMNPGGSSPTPTQPAAVLKGGGFITVPGGSTFTRTLIGVGLGTVSWSIYWAPGRPPNANLFTLSTTFTGGSLPDEYDSVDLLFDATALTSPLGTYSFLVAGLDSVSKQQIVVEGELAIR